MRIIFGCPIPECESKQSGDLSAIGKSCDEHGNPSGHDVYEASPADPDPMSKYTVPDCSYKEYNIFTWKPETK